MGSSWARSEGLRFFVLYRVQRNLLSSNRCNVARAFSKYLHYFNRSSSLYGGGWMLWPPFTSCALAIRLQARLLKKCKILWRDEERVLHIVSAICACTSHTSLSLSHAQQECVWIHYRKVLYEPRAPHLITKKHHLPWKRNSLTGDARALQFIGITRKTRTHVQQHILMGGARSVLGCCIQIPHTHTPNNTAPAVLILSNPSMRMFMRKLGTTAGFDSEKHMRGWMMHSLSPLSHPRRRRHTYYIYMPECVCLVWAHVAVKGCGEWAVFFTPCVNYPTIWPARSAQLDSVCVALCLRMKAWWDDYREQSDAGVCWRPARWRWGRDCRCIFATHTPLFLSISIALSPVVFCVRSHNDVGGCIA